MTSYTFNQYALPLLITGLAVLFLGVLTLAQERGSRVAGPFVLMSLTLAAWSFGMGTMYLSGSEETASLWAQLGHVGFIGDVGANEEGLDSRAGAGPADETHCFTCGIFIDVANHQVRAVLGERHGNGTADTSRGACDQHYFPMETE